MKDTITISLRALDERTREKLDKILDEQLNAVPDETNEQALDTLRKFKED